MPTHDHPATTRSQKRFDFEPYWVWIALFWLGSALLFIYHLISGQSPNRVLLRLPLLDFDVYWYGIVIIGGVVLGAYVVSHLVLEQAQRVLNSHVPPALRARPLTDLGLPADITLVLARQQLITIGDLLLQWGLEPRRLGLVEPALGTVRAELEQLPAMKPGWLEDAPWRPWNPDHVWNALTICLLLAVIGARLYHVLTPSPSMAAIGIESPLDYFRQPFQLFNLRQGGLGIYGGIAGGLLGLIGYTRRYGLPTLAWADLAAVGLALGQAVGRWGNFFNQELYGRPTNLPWAVHIDPRHRLAGYTEYATFHPAFLYESLWSFGAFLVLWLLARRYYRRLLPGDLMALYLILYAIGRSLLETVRLDSRAVVLAGINLHLPVATLVSILIALFMAGWMVWRRRGAVIGDR
jgi:phosphatidylglycerol---prolipoprotein diacylglyceryl transferase